MQLMKSMAQELAPKKIRVTVLRQVPYKHRSINRHGDTPEALKSLLTLIPYNRIGQPADIGKCAAWLASDESDYITGATIFVDEA